jgi:hypothetical protein
MRLSKRQKEIMQLMLRSPTCWPDLVSWQHVSAYARGRQKVGLRDQALRRVLWALSDRGLVHLKRGADTLGDYAPFNAILTAAGEDKAKQLAEDNNADAV